MYCVGKVLEFDIYFLSGNKKGTFGIGRRQFTDTKLREEFIKENQCRILSEPIGNDLKIIGGFRVI